MKSEKQELKKILGWCLAGIAVVCLFFFFVDSAWNGVFVDWFMREYMMESFSTVSGRDMLVREPVWSGVKRLICSLMCVNVVLWIITIYAVSRYQAKKQVRRTISEIGTGIGDYMKHGVSIEEAFDKEYAEISARMAEVKADIQRHEQLLKDETTRKNDLITYLAHDLKTPLTSVIGYLSLLDEAADMPGEQKARYIRIALNKADRLETLINEFFDITRYNLQQMILEKEEIDLYYMLVQMTDEFYPLLQAHDNRTELRVPEDARIFGDPVRLARVFNNILKNAVAYSYRGTPIEIWTEESEARLRICFCNQGKTIPAQKLEAIFEKFFRADEARASYTGGAGLGLAIAKEIVTLHGGTISAESQEERTTFCVALPRRDRHDQE